MKGYFLNNAKDRLRQWSSRFSGVDLSRSRALKSHSESRTAERGQGREKWGQIRSLRDFFGMALEDWRYSRVARSCKLMGVFSSKIKELVVVIIVDGLLKLALKDFQ